MELKEKERLEKENQVTMENRRKIQKDLTSCFEEVHDQIMLCYKDVETAMRNSKDYLDCCEMRSKLTSMKKGIDNISANFISIHNEKQNIIKDSVDMYEQLSVFTSFNKNIETKRKELEEFKEKLEEIKTIYGVTPCGRLARKIKFESIQLKDKSGLQLQKLPVKLIYSVYTFTLNVSSKKISIMLL